MIAFLFVVRLLKLSVGYKKVEISRDQVSNILNNLSGQIEKTEFLPESGHIAHLIYVFPVRGNRQPLQK